jgi:hypothetical protein
MARYGSFLYGRSGRYYARLRIPQALQGVFGKTHLRASLFTSDYEQARLRVLETVLWLPTASDELRTRVSHCCLLATDDANPFTRNAIQPSLRASQLR